MLIDFSFKNFSAFNNECKFSMLANADKEHENELINYDKNRLSRVKLIYGANASGKTTFIKAISFLSNFVAQSNMMLENKKINVAPFKFCNDCYNNPSEFSITFLKDNMKYCYKFSCTQDKVIDEKLDIYYSSKPTTIFERKNTNDYKFLIKDSKRLNEFKIKNTENKLFLSTSATWNYEKTKPVVDYLINTIVSVMDINELWQLNMNQFVNRNELNEYKKFCLNILNSTDISISDFSIEPQKLSDIGNEVFLLSDFLQAVTKQPEDMVNRALNDLNIFNLTTSHDIINENGITKYSLNLNEESLGTNQMFKLTTILYDVFKNGKVLFLDEIDKSLHPLLVEQIIKMFKSPTINKNNAQLIANTHDTNLLDLTLFRRDEIIFTERDYKTGSAEMYSLSDFSPRKGENIEKAYLLGRFGATPFIKEN